MAWKGKDITILLIDVGDTMCRQKMSAGSELVSKADVAMSLAKTLAQQKMLFLPRSELGIVFFGTTGTVNNLERDGYQNVTVAYDGVLRSPDLPMVQYLMKHPDGGAASDAVNGLIVTLDLLIQRTRDMKCTRTIHLLTDLASTSFGDEDLEECVRQLSATSTLLKVSLIGAPPMSLVDSDWGPWAPLARASPGCIELLPTELFARQSSLSVKPVELRAKVRMSLTISPQLEIPIGIYSRTTRVSFPTLKKSSKRAAPGAAHPAGGAPPSIPQDPLKKDAVMTDWTYHVADDPEGRDVAKEDRIKGHRYGSSIVPMSEYDEAALMYTCERTLTTLGFADSSALNPEHSVHHIEAVAADKGDAWAACAFESLVQVMVSEKLVLIARYAFRKNAQPRMVALWARKGENGCASILEMQYLPFFEDIREWSCPSLPTPSAEQDVVVESLVDALTLDGSTAAAEAVEKGPGSGDPEHFKLEDTNNPCLARFYDFVVQRLVTPGMKVPPCDQWNHLNIPAQAKERMEKRKVPDELKAKFNLQRVEKSGGKRKHFWREAIAEKRKDLDLGEVDTKRIRVPERLLGKKEEKKEDDEEEKKKVKAEDGGGGAASSAGPLFAQPVGVLPPVHVGSVHPERDFEKWLAQKGGGQDIVGEAMRQMKGIIERLVDEGEDFHGKALSCLSALRKGCVGEGEPGIFNNFVRLLAHGVTQRKMNFWKRASEASVGLITDGEVPTSTVSVEEARAFLRGEPYFPPSSASAAHRPEGSSGTPGGPPLTEQDLEAMID
uniref:ATP-dependent DNA helicase 2 subunit KU80 n=1 Tax=Crypthecodinium cohnii TaxID=2866 RepID=A0A516AGN0_CRYCO|nr:ATP-dependent DNA helicase 2 subunit KU80 [Crypthecodinium cohnii]